MVPLLLPLTRGQNGKRFPQETVRRRTQVYRYPGIGVHTPSKTAYPLTQHHLQLEIDIFTSKAGKQDAYHGKQYGYQEKSDLEVSGHRGAHPFKNRLLAYQTAFSIGNQYICP